VSRPARLTAAPFGREAAAAIADQRASNRAAAGASELYAGHRARLTAAIAELAAPGRRGRLALLGAGNCLDVDLAQLGALFAEVHLFDVDAPALRRARAGQPPSLRSRLHLHAPFDVSGALAGLDAGWRRRAPAAGELASALAACEARARDAVPRGCDVVASCCVATQLSRALLAALGAGHPAFASLRRHAVQAHLRTMAALTAPGGRALFASDVVSTETYPLEALAPDDDLDAVYERVVSDGNLFLGADPQLHLQLLRRDPVLAATFERPRRLPPWLWRTGPDRQFLVYALALCRRPSGWRRSVGFSVTIPDLS
jgi:hypothetical protein